MASSTNACDDGYKRLTSDGCKAAAEEHSFEWKEEETSASYPAGCYAHQRPGQSTPRVYFNRHATGGSHQLAKPMCIQGEKDEMACNASKTRLMAFSTNACDDGYKRLTSDSSCKAAAVEHCFEWKGKRTSASYPAGCYAYQPCTESGEGLKCKTPRVYF